DDYYRPPDFSGFLGAGWTVEVDEVRPRPGAESAEPGHTHDLVSRARRAAGSGTGPAEPEYPAPPSRHRDSSATRGPPHGGPLLVRRDQCPWSSPLRANNGPIPGSCPRKSVTAFIGSTLPPTERIFSRNRSPPSRVRPPLALNHSTLSASKTWLHT